MTSVTRRPSKTVEDFLALPEGVLAELIEGEIYVTPPPAPLHQRISRRILWHLETWIRSGGAGEVFTAPIGVFLPSGDVVEPDLVYLAADQASAVTERWIRGAPRLLVEIVSPTHPERDQIVKRDLYARCGVREYWIAHPADAAIETLRLEEDGYRPSGYFLRGSVLTSPTLPGFRLPLDDVFA